MKFQELPFFNMIIHLPSCLFQGTLRSSRQAATFLPLKDLALVTAAKIQNNRRFAVRKNVFFKRSQSRNKKCVFIIVQLCRAENPDFERSLQKCEKAF